MNFLLVPEYIIQVFPHKTSPHTAMLMAKIKKLWHLEGREENEKLKMTWSLNRLHCPAKEKSNHLYSVGIMSTYLKRDLKSSIVH